MHICLASGGIMQLLLNCTAMMVVKETPLQLKDLDEFTQAQFAGVKNHRWRRLASNFWQCRFAGSFGPATPCYRAFGQWGPPTVRSCARRALSSFPVRRRVQTEKPSVPKHLKCFAWECEVALRILIHSLACCRTVAPPTNAFTPHVCRRRSIA